MGRNTSLTDAIALKIFELLLIKNLNQKQTESQEESQFNNLQLKLKSRMINKLKQQFLRIQNKHKFLKHIQKLKPQKPQNH